jgi:serine/threonine protein kinase
MGRVLSDRYRLGSRIGGGGMGAVFQAEDEALQRTVAVKVIPGTEAADQQFLREARALSRLRHPGIVQLFDAGTDDGDGYLVLELIEGRTLAELLRQGALPPASVEQIGRQLAEALAHAHALGVVHRDVSPANVLVDDDGCMRLTDFGIARFAEATATVGGEIWGTPAFIAPEQVTGEAVGPPADVYALGLVLLEALTGTRAFPGTARESTLARLHRDALVPPDLPEPWPGLLRQMTARDPHARPSAASVAARLSGADAAVRTMAMPKAAMPLATPFGAAAAGRSVRHAPPLRRPIAAVAALLLLSAVLLGVALRADGPGTSLDGVEPATAATTPSPPPSPAPPTDTADDEDDEEEDEGKGRGKGRGKDKDD